MELCNAFKAQYSSRLIDQGSGGKTPGIRMGKTPLGNRTPGGRTPAVGFGGRGGATPMYGGRTPMPGQAPPQACTFKVSQPSRPPKAFHLYFCRGAPTERHRRRCPSHERLWRECDATQWVPRLRCPRSRVPTTSTSRLRDASTSARWIRRVRDACSRSARRRYAQRHEPRASVSTMS